MCIWLVMLVRILRVRILLLMGGILLARGALSMDTYVLVSRYTTKILDLDWSTMLNGDLPWQ